MLEKIDILDSIYKWSQEQKCSFHIVSKWLRIVLFETVNVRLYINIIQNKTRIESKNSFSNIDH